MEFVAAASVGECVPIARRASYRSVPPTHVNLDCLDAEWRVKALRIFNRRHAELPPAHLVTIENATTFAAGAIMCGGQLVEPTMLKQENARPSGIPAKYIEGDVALLRKPGDNNYGHWLLELLPKALEFRRLLPSEQLRFAVPLHPFAFQTTRLETLSLFGIKEEEVIWLDNNPTTFERLHVITSNSIHSHTHDFDGAQEVARRVVERFGASHDEPTKLYVPRPSGAKRVPTNNNEIWSRAREAGYQMIKPEELSFERQVQEFSRASHILGPQGAALSNLLWAKPATSVVAFTPSFGMEFFFWDVANIVGQEFNLLYGKALSNDVHSYYTIDCRYLDAILN